MRRDRATTRQAGPTAAGALAGTVLAAALACAACTGGGPMDSRGDPAGPASVSCTPSGSTPNQQNTDPNGPYGHQVVLGHTADGLAVTGAHQILDHASVPDGVRLADGSVLVYYVNGAAGSTYVARLEADTARVIGPIVVDGFQAPTGVVDPDAQLVNGKVRLTYLNGFGPPNSTVVRAMCMAESSDGVNFTTLGAAFTWNAGEQYTDPSVVPLPDGTWLMAISLGQQTVLARSSDGLRFTRDLALPYGGVPELAIPAPGVVRLYVCTGGITAYRSADNGRTWAREMTVVQGPFNGHNIVCDPSLVAGAGLFVFKTG